MIAFDSMKTDEEWFWFKHRTHVLRCEDAQGIVAYRDGQLVAALVADTWTSDSCCVHMAIDDPLVIRAGFLNEIGRHLFHACNRNHIFGMVPANNQKALKFDKHIGFKEVARIPDGVGTGTDYIILRMDKDECPWIEQKEAA